VSNVTVTTVALCFCVTLLEGFDIQALGISLGKLTTEFGLDGTQRTLLTTFSSVGIVLGAIVGGRLGDFLGRKPVLMGAVAGFGLFTLGMIAAPTFVALFVFRVLAGLGFGAALAMMMAIAAEISTPERRAFTGAVMFGIRAAYYPKRVRGTGSGACVSIGRVGSILGPLLAGIWLSGGTAAAQVIAYMAPFAAVAALAVYTLGRYPHGE
jgi:MFS family permease